MTRPHHWPKVETFKYFEVSFPIDERPNKKLDRRIFKVKTVLREVCRSVITKWNLGS